MKTLLIMILVLAGTAAQAANDDCIATLSGYSFGKQNVFLRYPVPYYGFVNTVESITHRDNTTYTGPNVRLSNIRKIKVNMGGYVTYVDVQLRSRSLNGCVFYGY